LRQRSRGPSAARRARCRLRNCRRRCGGIVARRDRAGARPCR
jgi:hypothetical protein